MNPDYISFVVVGKSEEHQAWLWKTWSKMVPILDPIVTATKSKVSVRSVQGGDNNKDVRFGRLGWDLKSHQKWSHGSVLSLSDSLIWEFCHTQIWAPSYTKLRDVREGPILFMDIEKPFLTVEPKKGQYNQFLLLAVPISFFASNRAIIESAVEQIAKLLESVLILVRISPWWIRGDSIQSALNNHLRYIGMHDHIIPDVSKTTGKWIAYEQINSVLNGDV